MHAWPYGEGITHFVQDIVQVILCIFNIFRSDMNVVYLIPGVSRCAVKADSCDT